MTHTADRPRLPEILLCGYERGGTTILSDLFRANGYLSGFECGVLMKNSPAEFQDYSPYIDMIPAGWKIKSSLEGVEFGENFGTFYNSLIRTAFPNASENARYFDKTPIYMQELGKCLSKTDFINKAVVIHRDPRGVFTSWAKRSITDSSQHIADIIQHYINDWTQRYLRYFKGCIAHTSQSNVLFVPFEELCINTEKWASAIGQFSKGINFDFTLDDETRSHNVRKGGITASIAEEFKHQLPLDLQRKILDATQLAAPFFYQDNLGRCYGELWQKTNGQIQETLDRFDLNEFSMDVDGAYFEPFTYLLRHEKLWNSNENPLTHFKSQLHE